MMRISSRFLAATLVFLSGVAGCDPRAAGGDAGNDPIEALGSASLSADFNVASWGEQRRGDTEIWQRATAFCDGKDGNEYPNCRPVLSLLLYQRTLDRPRDASPGLDGSLDMSDRADSARSRLDSLR